MDSLSARLQVADLARHVESLRALARGLVGDEHLAEDIVQDASLAALERPPREPGALGAWLRRTVVRRASNARRARARRGDHEADAVREEAPPGPDEIAFRVEVQQRLLAEVQTLPERYREVVWLRYWEQEAPADIARRLGVGRETVKTRLRRAHDLLRDGLDAREGGDRRAWAPALVAFALGGRDVASVAPRVGSLPLAVAAGALAATAGTWLLVAGGSGRAAPDVALEGVAALAADAVPVSGVLAVAPADEVLAPTRRAATDARRGALSVAVRWPDGAPAVDVGVILRPRDDARDDRRVRLADTDVAGTARLDALAPGAYTVELFRGGRTEVDVAAGAEARAALDVRPGVEVRGVVVDAAGRAVPGATVWLSRGGASWLAGRPVARADARGRFALRDVHPSHAVLASAPGFAPSAPRDVSAFRGFAPDDHDWATFDTLVLDAPGARLAGTVRGPDGRPVSGARVAVRSPHWRPIDGDLTAPPPARVATTGADGSFALAELPAGAVDVSVLADGLAPWLGRAEAPVHADAPLDVALEPGASLHGRVRDAAGRPVAGATVELAHDAPVGAPVSAFALPATTTDDAGAFALERVPAGPLVARVAARGRPALGVAREALRLAAGEVRRLDLLLSLAGTLHGRVVDARGAPLAGLLVRKSTGGGGRTDDDGAFHLGAFPGGPLRLELHPGFGFGTLLRVDVAPDVATPLELVVPDERLPTAGVRATVVDAAGVLPTGEPLLVEAEERERAGGFARRLVDGRVDFTTMVPGAYRLRVFTADRTLLVGDWFELAPNETRELGELATGPLASLRVELALPRGVPWTEVEATLVDAARRLHLYPTARDGALAVQGLLPGRYDLTVTAPGCALLVHPVDVAGEARARVALERLPHDPPTTPDRRSER